jgi:hypothetical protein
MAVSDEVGSTATTERRFQMGAVYGVGIGIYGNPDPDAALNVAIGLAMLALIAVFT